MGRRIDGGQWTAWRARLERYLASKARGVTVAAFCRREGVSVPAYYYWKKRLGVQIDGANSAGAARSIRPGSVRPETQAGTRRRSQRNMLVEVAVPRTELFRDLVEIQLSNGAIVRVTADREDAVAAAVRAVAELPPSVSRLTSETTRELPRGARPKTAREVASC